ncbi:MAG: nucleotidyltransferase [Deltaproteobacteria bacterium]|nr:MAG: nucleotidyltransferase [Deltaproteobacteria bacterium]RLA95686.1 MAG: nucleotidyltransferase [Deltaproteobacteria bacterium]
MDLNEALKVLREHKRELREKFGVKEIQIFGSYVRGDQKERSDIDLIVDFEDIPDLLEFIGLERRLEEILGVKVDLLTQESLSPYIRKYIEVIVV